MRWGGEAVGLGGKCYGPGSQSPQAACASLPGKEALMGSVGISVSRRGPGLGPWRWRARQRERGHLLDRGRWRRGDRRPRGAGGQGRTRPRLPGPALSCHGLWYRHNRQTEVRNRAFSSSTRFPAAVLRPPPRPVVISSPHRPHFLSLRKRKLSSVLLFAYIVLFVYV